MAVYQLKLQDIDKIGGGAVAIMWELASKRIGQDLRDRPGATDPRKLTMTASFVPVVDEAGELDSVNVKFEVKDSLPTRKTNDINMDLRKDMFVFNDMSAEDIDQMTLDQME